MARQRLKVKLEERASPCSLKSRSEVEGGLALQLETLELDPETWAEAVFSQQLPRTHTVPPCSAFLP